MGLQWNLCIFVCIAMVAMTTGRSTRRLDLNENHDVKIEDSAEAIPDDIEYEMPIHYFARHILCQNPTGKTAFYRVMANKLSTLDEKFVESFVFDLCRLHSRNGRILDRWVQELFDTDSDGYITGAEMHYYN